MIIPGLGTIVAGMRIFVGSGEIIIRVLATNVWTAVTIILGAGIIVRSGGIVVGSAGIITGDGEAIAGEEAVNAAAAGRIAAEEWGIAEGVSRKYGGETENEGVSGVFTN